NVTCTTLFEGKLNVVDTRNVSLENPPKYLSNWLALNGKIAHVSIAKSERGNGDVYYRFPSFESLGSFNNCRGNRKLDLEFIHANGFLCSSKERLDKKTELKLLKQFLNDN